MNALFNRSLRDLVIAKFLTTSNPIVNQLRFVDECCKDYSINRHPDLRHSDSLPVQPCISSPNIYLPKQRNNINGAVTVRSKDVEIVGMLGEFTVEVRDAKEVDELLDDDSVQSVSAFMVRRV